MIIDADFNLGDIVYFKTDPDQEDHMVTGVIVRQNAVFYEVCSGANSVSASPMELSLERDVLGIRHRNTLNT